jgi:hypothetical protein
MCYRQDNYFRLITFIEEQWNVCCHGHFAYFLALRASTWRLQEGKIVFLEWRFIFITWHLSRFPQHRVYPERCHVTKINRHSKNTVNLPYLLVNSKFYSLLVVRLIHVLENSSTFSINYDCLCGLVARVPCYTTEMYCVSCEVRTEFIYVM